MQYEDDIQRSLFQYFALIENQIPEIAFVYHVPNGGYRTKSTAAKLKQLGVKPGVPDIIVPMARNSYHGLAIELKRPGGRVSPNQQIWIQHLQLEHWYVMVCTDWPTAASAVLKYLGYEPTDYGL